MDSSGKLRQILGNVGKGLASQSAKIKEGGIPRMSTKPLWGRDKSAINS